MRSLVSAFVLYGELWVSKEIERKKLKLFECSRVVENVKKYFLQIEQLMKTQLIDERINEKS